jgi:hypothetical protein
MELLKDFTRVRKGNFGPASIDLLDPSSGPHTGPIQLSQLPRLSGFIEEWTSFRNRPIGTETSADTIEVQLKNQLHQDPTFLSLIAQKVRSVKEKLIRLDPTNLPVHINQEDFTSFRKELGAEIFQCRYGSCNHFSSSVRRRLEHETSHNPSFPCLHCDLSGRGFRSRRDLERHVKQYHCSDEDAVVPDSLTSIFERGQCTNNTSKALQYGSLSSREPGQWNEKGRKALQSMFRQVCNALALHEPHLAGKNGFNVSSDAQGELVSRTAASTIFASIERKIETGQYQTLKDFKTDINCFSQSIQSLEPADDLDKIQILFDKALEDAVNAFPGFTCVESQASLQRSIEHLLSAELERSCNSDKSHVFSESSEITSSQTQLGCKPVFWSKLEESELPSLLAQYGMGFSQIADFLKTKTSNEVEERFHLLVSSGRQDLAELVTLAEARLCGEQRQNNTMLLDTTTSAPAMLSPNAESTMDAETPDQARSRQESTSPANVFLESADTVPYFPLSETVSAYLPPRQLSTPKASGKQQQNQDSEDVERPKKYRRPTPPPAYCPHCKSKLRDDHTLSKHNERFHSPFRKVWICIDVSIDKNMLASCQSCRSGARYRSKHNAATHLRNKHFGPKASVETLTRWMEKVEEPNPNHSGSQLDSAASAAKSQKLRSISFWTATEEDQISEAEEENVFKEIPLLDVSFDDILQGYSGRTTPDSIATPRPSQDRPFNSSIPHLAHQGLIRVDQVDRLPNLNGPRKAVTRDQVVTYYQTLSESSVTSKKYEEAFENLKGLSQRLLKDLRDWRRDRTCAPEIRPSF